MCSHHTKNFHIPPAVIRFLRCSQSLRLLIMGYLSTPMQGSRSVADHKPTRSHGYQIRCRAGSLHRSTEVSHDQQAQILGASQKSNINWRDVEIFCMVAAQDEEKNYFSLRVKVGPDRDTMMPTKEPCRVGTISTSGIIFLGNGWPTLKAHATGPLCGPVSGRAFFPPGTAAVCLSC